MPRCDRADNFCNDGRRRRGAAFAASARRPSRKAATKVQRRLPAHARRRRPDLARHGSRHVREARRRARTAPVHDRPRALPGDDRRQHRHAGDRRRDLEFSRRADRARCSSLNDVEFATAQLWVREDQGIKSLRRFEGKQISTTTGTTAHVFLDTALRANKRRSEGRRGRQPADVRRR